MGCRPICLTPQAGEARAISPSSAGSRRKKASTARSRSRYAPGMPLKIAAKVDSRRPGLFRRSDQADARSSAGRVSSARSAMRDKAEFLSGAIGAAVADRLARAVRPGDDRGDGLRHAGDRLQSRLGAGDRRSRPDRLHRRGRDRRGRGGAIGSASSIAARCARNSKRDSPRGGWRWTISPPIAD